MRLNHVFVDSFPEPLEQRTLYVSMRYASVAHLCACGCGHEVVTPIRKRGWCLIFDGEAITLHPSIGSHNLDCQSHYFIRENEVRWAGRLSQEEILGGRTANQQGGLNIELVEEKETTLAATTQAAVEQEGDAAKPTPENKTWFVRAVDWCRRRLAPPP